MVKVLNDFRISVVQIILSNGKSFFLKVVEDSNTNPTQLESRQSEFGRRSYGRNTNVCPFLGRRPVHGKRGDRSLFGQRLAVGRRPVCGKCRDRSSFNQRLPVEKETGLRKTWRPVPKQSEPCCLEIDRSAQNRETGPLPEICCFGFFIKGMLVLSTGALYKQC